MLNRRMCDGRYGKVYESILTPGFLEEEYSNKKRTPYQIAVDVGCSPKVVYNYIDYYQIPRLNLTGTINPGDNFGLLTTIEVVRKSKNGTLIWKCQCECGNFNEVPTSRLKNGRSKSCGCYKKRKGGSHHLWKGYCDVSGSFIADIRCRAKKKGFDFDLDAEFLWILLQEQSSICAISGMKISLDDNASVDRIDSSKGYTKDNVWWVDAKVNIMKNNMDLKHFLDICSQITNNNIG